MKARTVRESRVRHRTAHLHFADTLLPYSSQSSCCLHRVEVDSKRSATRRVRHWSETSLDSMDLLLTPDDTDLSLAADDLDTQPSTSQTQAESQQMSAKNLDPPEMEYQEADEVSEKAEAVTSSPGKCGSHCMI